MKKQLSRRRFVAAAGIGTLASRNLLALGEAPRVPAKGAVRPVVISSANGNKSKDDGGLTCVAKAFKMITAGRDVLDAVIAGVNILELDPEDTSVGYGGLPNAEGVVQLDASVMHGPLKRAGAVACLEGVRTPSLVAKQIMEQTDRITRLNQVHASLQRLEEKGMIVSRMSEPTAERGGRRKRLFTITAFGKQTLRDIKAVRSHLWSLLPSSV